MLGIPREKTPRVQEILSKDISPAEKAKSIHKFDKNQSALETDGYVSGLMGESEIEALIIKGESDD